jgi:hypothetical protein
VLDDVQRRRLLVNPAGEDPLPAFVGALDIELDKGARQLLGFPRCRGLAGAQPDNRVLDPHRPAGTQNDVADDPVALVEKTEHRHALCHGGDAGQIVRGLRQADGACRRLAALLGVALAARGGKQGQRQDYRCGNAHAQSGIQGW